MPSEQRCGTCRHYFEFPDCDDGECRWAERRALPSCMEDRDWPVDPTDGVLCRLWQATGSPSRPGSALDQPGDIAAPDGRLTQPPREPRQPQPMRQHQGAE